MNAMTALNKLEKQMDKDTLKHCFQMNKLAKIYEKRKGIEGKILSDAAALCDTGKIYLSGKIRNKGFEEKLTIVERGIVDLYPFISYEVLKEMGVEDELCVLVLYHHGDNPRHVEDITLPELTPEIRQKARILHTICDYTALIEDRPYRNAFDKAGALLEMAQNAAEYDEETIEFIRNEEIRL